MASAAANAATPTEYVATKGQKLETKLAISLCNWPRALASSMLKDDLLPLIARITPQ
jgi:hypothetical protein